MEKKNDSTIITWTINVWMNKFSVVRARLTICHMRVMGVNADLDVFRAYTVILKSRGHKGLYRFVYALHARQFVSLM